MNTQVTTVVRDSRHRAGKTEKDHKSGAHQRCISNKQERADWQKNHGNKGLADFPWNTCNGKRFPTVVTGKGRTQRRITYVGMK